MLSPAGSCGRLQGGTALCWGSWGGDLLKVSSPAAGLAGVADLRIGHDLLEEPQQPYHDHLCAVLAAKTLECWGNGHQQQLGVDAGDNSPNPTSVSGLPSVVQVALGAHHTCALAEAGDVWCWGSNERGQLGIGRGLEAVRRPARVVGVEHVVQLLGATFNTCALTADHQVYCWGENLSGEAGTPNVGHPIVWLPNRVQIASGSRQLAGNYSTLCALKLDGKIACWGYLTDQLGEPFEKSISGDVPDISDATAIAVGLKHACMVRRDGTVWCWGNNEAAQLGGGGASSARPVRVALPARATGVAAGKRSTCARLEDRRWYCWGENRSGQIGPRSQPLIATPTLLDLSQVDLASQ